MNKGTKGGFYTDYDFLGNWDALFPEDENGQPVEPRQADPGSVDLRLGSYYYLTSELKPGRLTEADPYLRIPPGTFAALTVWERVHVPKDALGLLTMKFTFKSKGLLNVSGFHVDPGFNGQLVYSVFNLGGQDVTIGLREKVFTIFLADLRQSPSKGYEGPRGADGIPATMVRELGTDLVNLVELNKKVERLQGQANLFITGLIAVGVPVGVMLAERWLS